MGQIDDEGLDYTGHTMYGDTAALHTRENCWCFTRSGSDGGLRKRVAEAFGLEDAPTGEKECLCTYIEKDDGTWQVSEFTNYSEELNAIVALIAQHTKAAVLAGQLKGAEELAALLIEGSQQTGSVNISEGLAVFKTSLQAEQLKLTEER